MNKIVISSISFVASFLIGGVASFASAKIGNNAVSDSSFGIDSDNSSFDDFDDNVEETPFSKLLSSIVGAQEIVFDSADIHITPESAGQISLGLSDVYVIKDGESYNASVGEAKVFYKNNLQADIALRYESDKAFINFLTAKEKGTKNAYTISLPNTIDSVSTLLTALGIDALKESGSSVSLDDILNEFTKALSNVKESTTENGNSYLISVASLPVGDIAINGLNIELLTDKENQFIGGSIDPFTITLSDNTKITVDVSASAHLNNDSTLKDDKEEYQDITSATGSILSTLADLCDTKIGKFDIDIDTDIKDTKVGLNGSLYVNAKDTFLDFGKSEYYLDLTHYGKDNVGHNDIKAHYKNETIYLGLNDLFKGYLSNTDISNFFTYMDEVIDATDGTTRTKKAFSSVSDMLNVVIEDIDIPSLSLGEIDFSSFSLPTVIESFTYRENSDFELVIDASYFNLGDTSIDIQVFFNTTTDEEGEKESSIKSIQVSGLVYEDIKLNKISISPKAIEESVFQDAISTQLEKEKTEYSSYSSTLNIFESLTDLVSSKKVNADLSLAFKDEANQAEYTADMNLQADLTSLTKDSSLNLKSVDDLVKYYGKGKYQIGMDLNVSQKENIIGDDNKTVIDKINHSQAHNLSLAYQNENLFAAYRYDNTASDYVFKQYFPTSQFGALKDIIDKYSSKATSNVSSSDSDSNSENVSESLFDIADVISAIAGSDKLDSLTKSIQNGSLKELDSLLSLSNDGTNTLIGIEPDYLLSNTKYKGKFSTLKLSLSNSGKIVSLSGSMSFLMNGKNESLSFTLSLNDDIDITVLPTEEKDIEDLGYVKFNNANNLMSAFMAMPTDLKKFGIRIDGSLSVLSDGKVSNAITVGKNKEGTLYSEAKVDATNGVDSMSMEGQVHIQHDSLFNEGERPYQDLEFKYNTDDYKNQIVAEYNDKMRMTIDNSAILSGDDSIVSQLKAIGEDNLLLRYFDKLNTTDTSLPIADLITYKDPAKLLRYSYIQKIEITDTQVVIEVDRKLFDSSDTSKESDIITISYSGTGENASVDSINIQGQYGSSMQIVSVTATLVDYDSVSSVSFNESANILDMNGIKTLMTCLIDTTDNNYFEFAPARLKLSLTSLVSIDVTMSGKVYVADNHAYAYLKFTSDNVDDYTAKGFHCTEFFVMEENIWVSQTKTSTSSGKYTYTNEHFKVTKDELLDNAVYYLLQYTCNFGDNGLERLVINQIYDAMNEDSSSSSVTLNDDLSTLISSVNYGDGYFDMSLELKNLVTIPLISIGTTSIKVGYNTDTTGDIKDHRFTSFTLNTKISVLGIISAKIDNFTVNMSSKNLGTDYAKVVKEGGEMSRFYQFVSAFESNYSSLYQGIGYNELNTSHQDTSILDFYTCTVSSATSIKDNGMKKTLSETHSTKEEPTSPFFYHD